MKRRESMLLEALAHIAKAADDALHEHPHVCGESHNHHHHEANGAVAEPLTCIPKTLPDRLLERGARTASQINPVNAPVMAGLFATGQAGLEARVLEPARIAVLTTKYWGARPRQLTVSFMESTPTDLRNRILAHMNAWTRTGSISFVWTAGTGEIRISRGSGGYYSYLGTDVLLIPRQRQTMNLEGFTMSTPESEYKRVIRHETGHTLGCPHEHMRRDLVARIDPQKAYDYFWRTQRWDKAMVDSQVLTSLDERSLMSTPADQTSIMCYQLPGSITRDGRPILGGADINATDYTFIGRIYPRVAPAAALASDGVVELEESEAAGGAGRSFGAEANGVDPNDWDPSEDVREEDLALV
jgi:hypothetical protein